MGGNIGDRAIGGGSHVSASASARIHEVHQELANLEAKLDNDLELAVELAAAITSTDPEESDRPFILLAVVMLSFIGFWVVVVCSACSAVSRRLGGYAAVVVSGRGKASRYGRLDGRGYPPPATRVAEEMVPQPRLPEHVI